MPADKIKIVALETSLNEAADGLTKVTSKKMFGCHALFASGNVFALVWKHGQIGVKLPNEVDYKKLLAIKGSGPWKAGPMTMAHWVLVPEAVQESQKKLVPWVKRAHQLALAAPAKPAKKAKGKRS